MTVLIVIHFFCKRFKSKVRKKRYKCKNCDDGANLINKQNQNASVSEPSKNSSDSGESSLLDSSKSDSPFDVETAKEETTCPHIEEIIEAENAIICNTKVRFKYNADHENLCPFLHLF